MRFSDQLTAGIRYWRGDPDCQAAHDEMVQHLHSRGTRFLDSTQALSERQRGNLGEHIAFRIGSATHFHNLHRVIANAAQPLSNNSAAGIDIMWVLLHTTDPRNDLVYVQEMKTTSDSSLRYAYELTQDYKKLFDIKYPDFSLGTRLQSLATELEYTLRIPEEMQHRITALGQSAPALCTQVHLVPTLVHDRAHDPQAKLLGVTRSIVGLGWSSNAVSPWSIALTDLHDRLERIAHGAA